MTPKPLSQLREEFVDAMARERDHFQDKDTPQEVDYAARFLVAALESKEEPKPAERTAEEDRPNTKTPIGGWIKAVFMQEGDLPTVADCCRLAALIEHGVVGSHEYSALRAERDELKARVEKAKTLLRDDRAHSLVEGVKPQCLVCDAIRILEGEK